MTKKKSKVDGFLLVLADGEVAVAAEGPIKGQQRNHFVSIREEILYCTRTFTSVPMQSVLLC